MTKVGLEVQKDHEMRAIIHLTKKSSCVNARGIPTATYQVLAMLGGGVPCSRSGGVPHPRSGGGTTSQVWGVLCPSFGGYHIPGLGGYTVPGLGGGTLSQQGSHSHWKNWKTWINERSFSSQGKVREF